jgi:RNA ligase
VTTALTTTTLADVIDLQLLNEMLDGGYVRKQVHPTEPYSILNYTEKAAYESVWNQVTLRCRGLIYNHHTGEVLARCLSKFFNYGQTGAPELDLNEPVIVTDKKDGSMGLIFPTSDGWAVATRGSFASEQAIHATALLRERYPNFEPPKGHTVLVEIVYPMNRIVLDYGQLDDLILLGAVDISTGLSVPPDWGFLKWPGPSTEIFDYRTLADALVAEPRPNAEGLVVHFLASDERVKIKQADYVALHKIVTGLNARTVWQHLVDGKPLDELIAPLPDEFHEWVKATAEGILTGVDERERALHDLFAETNARLGDVSRKDFAIAISQHLDKSFLFSLADGKDIRPKLMSHAKPEAYVTPSGRIFTEETA